MAKVNPNSKASRLRAAKLLLSGLVRSPKTRDGLVAAAKKKGVSANFVYGWLANAQRTGEVIEHKSSEPVTYQLATYAAQEQPTAGVYPEWLEPRGLPAFTARQAHIDGH